MLSNKITDYLNEKRKLPAGFLINLGAMALFSVIIVVIMTIIHLSNERAYDLFFCGKGMALKLAFNFVLVFLIFNLFFAIIKNLAVVNAIVTAFFSIFAYAINVVLIITGDPLLPSDFVLAGSLDNLVSFVDIPVLKTDIIAGSIMILSIAVGFLLFRKRAEMSLKVWVPQAVISLAFISVIFYFFGFNHTFVYDMLPSRGIWVTAVEHETDYLRNGALLSFIPKLGDLVPPSIEGYDESVIKDIKKGFEGRSEFYHYDDVKPDVIVIQSEAWWDATKLKDVTFSTDPIPFFRNGGKNIFTSEMYSPVFAGGTCMPEFEFLTGFNTIFLPANCYPYIQAIKKETPSIAKVFKANGYQTDVIHPYKKTFYGRNVAYKLLGFDNFIDAEDMENPDISGFYVSDKSAAGEIIKRYENKKKDNAFIFTITMQNHGDYEKPRYGWYDVNVNSDTLSDSELSGLRDFTKGIYDADNMFKQLTEYFSNVEKPVVIMMYGDHLPLLGNEGSTYVNGGMVENDGEFDYKKHGECFKTPFILWTNYNLNPNFTIPKEISPQGISSLALRMANLKNIPWYYFLFDEFYGKYPIYSQFVVKDSGYNAVQGISDADWPTTNSYKLVQYDLIYGKQYAEK